MTTEHTLTGNLADLAGSSTPSRIILATIDTNLNGEALKDYDNNEVRLDGPKQLVLATDGTFSIDLIATDSTGTNVLDDSLRYIVRVNYKDATGRTRSWDSGYFDLTADADLSDKAGSDVTIPVVPGPSPTLLDAPTAANVNDAGSQTGSALRALFVSPSAKTTLGAAAPIPWVNVKDFGAVGDGLADDQPAVQAAIDAAETLGNGAVVYFPVGSYKLGTTLVVNKGIFLVAGGYGDVTPVTSGSMTSATQGTKLLWAGGANSMVWFVAPVVDETLHGGGIMGLLLDGNNVATNGVRVSSCRNTTVDVAVRRVISKGILLDDTNGRLCSEIYIPRFVFRIESNAATQGAVGIHVKGDVSATGFGCTSIYMGNLDIEHENGDALMFEDCDSCYVAHFKAVNRTAGYTGQGVRFMQGDGAFPARKNYIAHLARGRVHAEPGTANAAGFVNSEGGAVISGSGIFHYRVIDRNTGELFQTLVHKMSDWVTLSADSLRGTATDSTASGNSWAIKAFADGVSHYLGGAIPMPPDWEKGSIEKIEVLLCRGTAGDANNDVRLQADLMVVADGSAFTATPTQKAVTYALPAATGTVQRAAITFDTPVAIASRDRAVFLKLTRLGTDAADTYTGSLGVFAIRVYFAGTGPDDPGTGPWGIPPVSI